MCRLFKVDIPFYSTLEYSTTFWTIYFKKTKGWLSFTIVNSPIGANSSGAHGLMTIPEDIGWWGDRQLSCISQQLRVLSVSLLSYQQSEPFWWISSVIKGHHVPFGGPKHCAFRRSNTNYEHGADATLMSYSEKFFFIRMCTFHLWTIWDLSHDRNLQYDHLNADVVAMYAITDPLWNVPGLVLDAGRRIDLAQNRKNSSGAIELYYCAIDSLKKSLRHTPFVTRCLLF